MKLLKNLRFYLFSCLVIIILVFSSCENKKTGGIDDFDLSKLPIKCKMFVLAIDAVKNNDGSGLVKNKNAEKSFTVASFFANPCLNALDNLEKREKQKLVDKIKVLVIKNEKLRLEIEFLKKSLKK